MKRHLSNTKKLHLFLPDLISGIAAVLLFLTLLSFWFLSGLYAKFTVMDSDSDNARVAKGLPTIELWEHKADLQNGIYVLDENKKVTSNTYSKVLPGVDIAKDPFIVVNGSLESDEVDYELYVKISKNNFPVRTDKNGKTIETVKYEIDTQHWQKVSGEDDTYKYIDQISVDTPINILKDKKIIVSEYYDGSTQKPKEFSLSFDAWLK